MYHGDDHQDKTVKLIGETYSTGFEVGHYTVCFDDDTYLTVSKDQPGLTVHYK